MSNTTMAELTQLLRESLPPDRHNRSDPAAYEDYRRQALAVLFGAGLSTIRANALVDDLIAALNTRPNLIAKREKELAKHGNRKSEIRSMGHSGNYGPPTLCRPGY